MRRLALTIVVFLPGAAFYCFGLPMVGTGLLTLGLNSAAAVFFDDPAQKGAALYLSERWSEAAEAFGSNSSNAYNRGNALAHAERFTEAIAAYDQALSAEPENEDAAFNKALLAALIDERPAGADYGSINANSAASRARETHESPHADGETGGSGDGFAGDRESASKPGAQGSSKAGKIGKGDQAASDSGQGQAKGSAGDSEGAGRVGGVQVDVAKTIRDRDRHIRRRMEARSIQPTPEWLSSLPDDPGRFLKLRILAQKAQRKALSSSSNQGADP